MKLQNQVAIITGGGGVLGGAIARKLAAEGAKIALFDIRQEFAENTAAAITAAGGEATAHGVDITNADDARRNVDDVFARYGRLDILVNCAGGSARKQMKFFHEQTLDVVRDVIAVNLFGMLNCTHAAAKHMVAARFGKIVNIGSTVGVQGLEKSVDYAAAKGAIIAATRALAKELGPHDINVNCVSPGIVLREPTADPLAFAKKHSSMNRLCTPDDIANVVVFLTLPESGYIIGQNHIVDGGRSLAMMGSGIR
ncbi:SDR family oxidoreductase [Opitutaceae bacterium TAV4]|uniref:SDR family NAD(P)-dependent oxidoreductase n=1 Tax=Geminisphaera colitermitum TaxID=1148786 RepID=UPI000158C5A1|nr:SDR family oxidoreductase [Geminisphaera colitermitum]RRJ94602.1 SDR family oxidoreductase [Opitutaceae bacterium TAV4]RRJ98668.1 SDR family oxidoreductase [Opitutaceae bacterium TAV3]